MSVSSLLSEHGYHVLELTPLHSHTSEVFRARFDSGSVIARFTRSADHEATNTALMRQTRNSRALVSAGVPFTDPLVLDILQSDTLYATLWNDLGPTEALDYAELGRALRHFQSVAPQALPLEDLPLLLDAPVLVESYRDLYARKLIPQNFLTRALRTIDATLEKFEQLPGVPDTVVHDDLWSKNIVARADGVHLLDPDSLSWGRSDHDLNFIARAHAAKMITDEDATRFVSGYGAPLPPLDNITAASHLHLLKLTPGVLLRHRIDGQPLYHFSELSLWRTIA